MTLTLKGVAEWGAAVTAVVDGVDMAVRKSVSEGALLQKRTVRANMEGAPRWVKGVNYPRSGGVGKLTGRLLKSVSYRPVQRLGYGHYMTTLRAGRIYAIKDENAYPYFRPGVRESTPAVERIFLANYAKAIAKA